MLSGFVVDALHPGDEALEALRPPVFWGRGTADGVIPGSNIASTAAWLERHATAQTEVYEGLDHSIANRELHDINVFIREHLK
jgi:phospholipase/carboxylesterase